MSFIWIRKKNIFALSLALKQRLGATQNGLVIGISLNYFARAFHSLKGQKTVVSNNLLDLKIIFIACAKLISREAYKSHMISVKWYTQSNLAFVERNDFQKNILTLCFSFLFLEK